jgi:hypothetical protein
MKDFLRKMKQSPEISWKKFTIFKIIGFRRLPKYGKILKHFYFIICPSQIWLIPLVDDHQYGFITKLKKKTVEICRSKRKKEANCLNLLVAREKETR